MKHSITVEKLFNPDDIAQIDSVYYKTWLTTYPNKELGITENDIHQLFKDSNNPASLDEKIKRIQNFPNTVFFFIAKDGDRVIGLCMVTEKDTYNQLQQIYILPEYQHQGIGSLLWSKLSSHIDTRKKTIVHVATYNTGAITFYTKLGFVDTGKRLTEERHRMPISKVIIPEMEMEKIATE